MRSARHLLDERIHAFAIRAVAKFVDHLRQLRTRQFPSVLRFHRPTSAFLCRPIARRREYCGRNTELARTAQVAMREVVRRAMTVMRAPTIAAQGPTFT